MWAPTGNLLGTKSTAHPTQCFLQFLLQMSDLQCGIKTSPPLPAFLFLCVCKQNYNQWTTREVPVTFILQRCPLPFNTLLVHLITCWHLFLEDLKGHTTNWKENVCIDLKISLSWTCQVRIYSSVLKTDYKAFGFYIWGFN